MIGTTDGNLLQRLQWGEYGNGMIEWRGMNMLIITHDDKDDETAKSHDMDGMQSTADCLSSTGHSTAENRSHSFRSNAQSAERNTDVHLSRETLLARLRCRTEERLQNKATLKRSTSNLSRGMSS